LSSSNTIGYIVYLRWPNVIIIIIIIIQSPPSTRVLVVLLDHAFKVRLVLSAPNRHLPNLALFVIIVRTPAVLKASALTVILASIATPLVVLVLEEIILITIVAMTTSIRVLATSAPVVVKGVSTFRLDYANVLVLLFIALLYVGTRQCMSE